MTPYPALLLLLLAACQPERSATTIASPPAPAQPVATTAPTMASLDTLPVVDSLGRPLATAWLRPATKAAFDYLRARDPLPARPTDALTAADAPLPADGRVRRQGERLVLQPRQGPLVTLRPVPSPDGPQGNDNAYYYWGSLPAVHQWVIDVSPDEGSAVLLIDQRTGQRTPLLGYPSVSPDGRHLLSVCEDMASGAGVTNLTLYRCGAAAPRLVWTRDLTEWGPRRAYWRDARHVVVAQTHFPADGQVLAATRLPLTYVELELPRLK